MRNENAKVYALTENDNVLGKSSVSIRCYALGSPIPGPERGVSLEEPAAENLHGGIREGGDCLESWPTYTRTKLETADRSQGTPTTQGGLLYSE